MNFCIKRAVRKIL